MKKEMSEIKRRALLAKQRMKMGYWQKMQAERDRIMTETDDVSRIEMASNLRRKEFERTNNMALGDDFTEKDEKLYVKVKNILEKDENTLNPIGQLVEHSIYDFMDEANKQRYILELSAKFRELRERYYKEKAKYV